VEGLDGGRSFAVNASFTQIHCKVSVLCVLEWSARNSHLKMSDLLADHQGQVGTEKEDFAEECQRLC